MSYLLLLLKAYWKPIAGLAAVIALVLYLMHVGAERERQKQATKDAVAEVVKAKAATAHALDLASKIAEAHLQYEAATERTAVIATQAVQARVAIETNTKEIIRYVKTYVPAGSPALPGGYRLLHDAAATGVPPREASASAPSGTDAAPVSAQDAASAVIENYGTYHQLAKRMQLLQLWVNKECH